MTLTYTDGVDGLFDILGKYLFARNTLDTERAATVAAEVLDAVDQYRAKADATLDMDAAMEGVAQAELSWRSGGSTFASALKTAINNFLTEEVRADSENAGTSVVEALEYLIDAMISDGYYVTPSVVSVTPAADAGNVANDLVVKATIIDGKGRDSENAYAEVIRLEATARSKTSPLSVLGERAAPSAQSEAWPAGSAISSTLTPLTIADSLLTNSGFDDFTVADMPDDWAATAGVPGTAFRATLYTVQTVIMSGTPTAGTYHLKYTDNVTGLVYVTTPLAYDANSATVQAALRLLPGLSAITIVESGSGPNYTHTVTLTEVPGQVAALTSINNTVSGSIAHAVTVVGDTGAITDRGLLIPDSDVQVTLYQNVTLTNETVYAFGFWMYASGAGTVNGTVSLVDGIGGTILQDDEGVNQTLSWSSSAANWTHYDGFFRVAKTVTSPVYLRFDSPGAEIEALVLVVDDLILAPAQRLYTGGPYVAAYPGRLVNAIENKWTLTVANDYAGLWQKDFDREFDMKGNDLLLPSVTTTTLINNNLIS